MTKHQLRLKMWLQYPLLSLSDLPSTDRRRPLRLSSSTLTLGRHSIPPLHRHSASSHVLHAAALPPTSRRLCFRCTFKALTSKSCLHYSLYFHYSYELIDWLFWLEYSMKITIAYLKILVTRLNWSSFFGSATEKNSSSLKSQSPGDRRGF